LYPDGTSTQQQMNAILHSAWISNLHLVHLELNHWCGTHRIATQATHNMGLNNPGFLL